MNPSTPASEGNIPWRPPGTNREYRSWYRVVGDERPTQTPLLCLHGGPGTPHDYLEPLEALASQRQVVFYDQLGCGNSDAVEDPVLFSMALFLAEIDAVRRALGLKRLHLFGHSWGGMLALEYALRQPPGLVSLILANTAASTPQWMAEMRRLITEMDPAVQQAIATHEAAGTTGSPEYRDAARAFYLRYIRAHVEPRPAYMRRMAGKYSLEAYAQMWGPSEFLVNGSLKDWDVSARLGEIRVPALVLGGRHDHATPAVTGALARGIPGAEHVIFEHSAHVPHIEEKERFLQVVSAFLARVDTGEGRRR